MDIFDILLMHNVGDDSTIPTITNLPASDATQRGKIYRLLGADNMEDQIYVCKKMVDGSYKWVVWAEQLSDLLDDATHRLVSDQQIMTWNAKASTAVVTVNTNGLMSYADKVKLDGVSSGANKTQVSTTNGNMRVDGVEIVVYAHPVNHPPSIISQDINNRFVSDAQINIWNAKASTAVATAGVDGLMSSVDKTKLDGISPNANKTQASTSNGSVRVDNADIVVYTHPGNHPASMITQDVNNRFVSDAEKTTWNAKASTAVATQAVNGLMASGDKVKLDGISSGANRTVASANNGSVKVDGVDTVVYTHPANHPASIITQDVNNRFVSDADKATWNAKASTAVATTLANGLMSAGDKSKLDGIASGADAVAVSSTNGNILINNSEVVVYTHPANHPGTMITEDTTHRWFTDTERTKLTGISSGANKTTASATNGNVTVDGAQVVVYTHPANHPASVITQDVNNRFVSDSQINTWNKTSTTMATRTVNGLMSANDKSKLDAIIDGTSVVTTDPNGNFSVTMPDTGYARMYASYVSGDTGAAGGAVIPGGVISANSTGFSGNFTRPNGAPVANVTLRVNWHALLSNN